MAEQAQGHFWDEPEAIESGQAKGAERAGEGGRDGVAVEGVARADQTQAGEKTTRPKRRGPPAGNKNAVKGIPRAGYVPPEKPPLRELDDNLQLSLADRKELKQLSIQNAEHKVKDPATSDTANARFNDFLYTVASEGSIDQMSAVDAAAIFRDLYEQTRAKTFTAPQPPCEVPDKPPESAAQASLFDDQLETPEP